MLRDHARGAIELQGEADGDVGGDGGRCDRVEAIAGGAGKELAMAAEAGRTRGMASSTCLGMASSAGFRVPASASSALRWLAAVSHFVGVRPSPRMA